MRLVPLRHGQKGCLYVDYMKPCSCCFVLEPVRVNLLLRVPSMSSVRHAGSRFRCAAEVACSQAGLSGHRRYDHDWVPSGRTPLSIQTDCERPDDTSVFAVQPRDAHGIHAPRMMRKRF